MTKLTGKHSKHTVLAVAFGLCQAFTFSLAPALAADGTINLAGRSLFSLQAEAGGLSPAQRAEITQGNLDNALVATTDRSPSAVNIVYFKGMPIITLGGYHVVTADINSAKAAGTSPAALAARWADSLRQALGDASAVDGYVAQISGSASTGQSSGDAGRATVRQGHVVFVPAGMTFPVTLSGALSSALAKPGDPVEAKIAQDVLLGDSSIPKGTVVLGQVIDSQAGQRLGRSGKLGLKFNRLRTADGVETPINAHIVGGLDAFAQTAGTDSFKGESTEKKVEKAAIHGAIGAGTGVLVGSTIGAIAGHTGGSVGRGALSGIVLGGALGVAESLLVRKGADVTVSSGQSLKLQLDAPVSLAVTTAANIQ